MAANYERGLYKEYERLLSENAALKTDRVTLSNASRLLQIEIQLRERLEMELKAKTAEIEALQKEILRLNGMLNLDGTNSGVSTARTPLFKKKVIPNSRTKSGKPIGGQPGHTKSKLPAFAEDEVTETILHQPEACPSCDGQVEDTGRVINKDELDYKVVVIKRRHQFSVCKCTSCGYEFHSPIPVSLKEENQYGSRVQALGLSLMNIGNMSVNKVQKMIYGLSEEEIKPSEGYLMKQQRKAAGELEPFINELKKACLLLGMLYWDDTVIDINKRRGCLRFYGNEQMALYTAHLHKNKAGLDDDGILKLLPAETIVVHDHNKVNYNKTYSFSNIECNVHLLRDLQKTTDNLQHSWSAELKNLLEKTHTDRNEAMERGEAAFDDADVREFFLTFDRIMLRAAEENRGDFNRYYGSEERTLILRILDYKDNYFAWVVNFELPFSNNLSERALRGIKSKMKVSGQFQSEETAGHYAKVKSYIETCYRNGINEVAALLRLATGNPYTLKEILATNGE